jgi:ATP-dependent Clp protease protease subunit
MGKLNIPANLLRMECFAFQNRRIPFNGIVDETLAKFVCDRIAFFNALDQNAPIFIVIDRSPGGSVMSGYQILQAMESSRAPVYVVVKGYAASMAAIITTMAKRSYVYPQTVVLHHQASTSLSGNQTQLQQQLKWSKIWCERIFIKVADKMGISMDEFVSKMYAAVSTGDWKVLGTEAVKLNWVTQVVDRMAEEGINNTPVAPPLAELKPDGFNGAIALNPLSPFDIWWIYDPSTEFIYR